MKNILILLAFILTMTALTLPTYGQDDQLQKALDAQRNFNAVQTIYRAGVPHTDRQGNMLMKYDAGKSFFPIGVWGMAAEEPEQPGTPGRARIDWQVLRDAGFNTVWPWPVGGRKPAIESARRTGLQMILMEPIEQDQIPLLEQNRDLLLGNVYVDEPIGKLGSVDMDKLYDEFNAYREQIQQKIPGLPVFVNDAAWITPPARTWWLKWTRSGDLSCHDNYPIMLMNSLPRSIAAEPNGIPQSVSLATGANEEKRPVWLIVGAFDQVKPYGDPFQFRMPTPAQLRSQVYDAIIQGATGIHYFIYDSYVSRDGRCVGMSPDPREVVLVKDGKPKTPATPLQLINSRALWEATRQINAELGELTPAILSPTAGADIAYSTEISGSAVSQNPLAVLLKTRPDGKFVLLTVNCDDAVLNVNFTFTPVLNNVSQLFAEDTRLTATANQIKTVYEPYQVRVIELDIARP
ncbi:MAG: hypothetical protein IT448_11725 [Phycisphaerales bacterium]|nr:hypothetical protein [Phycisphaerales bacterium]